MNTIILVFTSKETMLMLIEYLKKNVLVKYVQNIRTFIMSDNTDHLFCKYHQLYHCSNHNLAVNIHNNKSDFIYLLSINFSFNMSSNEIFNFILFLKQYNSILALNFYWYL